MHQKLLFSTCLKSMLVTIITISFLISFVNFDAYATSTISFSSPHTISSGGISSSGTPLNFKITVTDDDPKFVNGIQDSITVKVESEAPEATSIELVLLETGTDTGIFRNTNLVFLSDDSYFVTDSNSITVKLDKRKTIDNIPTGFDTDNKITQWPFYKVRTSSNTAGIDLILTEESANSGIFNGTVRLGTATDSNLNLIKTKPGDVITFHETLPNSKFLLTNAFVVGSIDKTIGSIVAFDKNKSSVKLTVTYVDGNGNTYKATVDIDQDDPGSGGSGSGGLIRPSLVVDTTPSGGPGDTSSTDKGSGCSGDCSPPTLGLDENYNRIVTGGFSYNDNPIDVQQYYTPYPLITANVGEENTTILKIYDNSGTQNIEHVGLAFGLGKGESFSDSKATISLDRKRDGTESVSVYDPENALDNVRITTETGKCSDDLYGPQCLIVTIHHRFRESLNFNMVATYVWDFNKNGWQNYYNHGIEIVGDSLNPPKTKMTAFGTTEMRGLYELVQVDKKNDIWRDEFGNLYHYHGNDRFGLIYSVPQEIKYDKLTMHGCDRKCNWFENYKLNEELLAQRTLNDQILRGKSIIGEPPSEPLTFYSHYLKRSEDPELQRHILSEQERATELYHSLFDGLHP